MKNIHIPSLILAACVIVSFLGVAVSIGYRSFLFAAIFTLLGFVLMGFGIRRKKRRTT